MLTTLFRNTVAALALLMFGCTTHSPDMGELYNEAARRQSVEGNPVILIPGVLGSTLMDPASGRVVWGAFRRGDSDAGTSDGARLIALPMDPGYPLDQLRDEVTPAGVLDNMKVSFLNLPIALQAYKRILATLGVAGYFDESLGRAGGAVDYGTNHFTCFQFDYDWRRSNAENAARLEAFIQEKAAYVKREKFKRSGKEQADVKFDIVAHSMGGLLTRYYLRYGGVPLPPEGTPPEPTWAGARHVGRVILVGTPNAGSAKALVKITEGLHLPSIVTLPPALLGTFPSVYEVLPRARHGAVVSGDAEPQPVDFMDFATWERNQWGLADPKQDRLLQQLLPDVPDPATRRAIALNHLRKCLSNAHRFQAALDVPASPPSGTEIILIAGDAEPTISVLEVSRNHKLKPLVFAPGDGVVTRASAIMDERVGAKWVPRIQSPVDWDQIVFLFASHRGMTSSPEFADNMLFLLLEKPRPGL